MSDIRILAVPQGRFNPFEYGNAFYPYEGSPDVWILQIKNEHNLWMPIQLVHLQDIHPDENRLTWRPK